MNLVYPYTAEPQEPNGYLVQFLDFEEGFTEGDTLEECAFNAAEVLSGILISRIGQNQDIPAPSSADGCPVASPDASVQSAILLRLARGDRPMSDIARALDTSWASVQRLENPNHWPSLKQLDRAAHVFGKRLVLSMV